MSVYKNTPLLYHKCELCHLAHSCFLTNNLHHTESLFSFQINATWNESFSTAQNSRQRKRRLENSLGERNEKLLRRSELQCRFCIQEMQCAESHLLLELPSGAGAALGGEGTGAGLSSQHSLLTCLAGARSFPAHQKVLGNLVSLSAAVYSHFILQLTAGRAIGPCVT